MLAVIGAMKEEVDLIEAETTVSQRRVHAGIEVIRGRFRDTELVLAQCGIGKVNATICTQMAARAFDAAFPAAASGPNLMLGTVVSGDRFIQDPETLRWLQREFAALATEMEGAAVGYTYGLNAVPFVVIRVLSDTASESASGDFVSNLAKVCRNSFAILERLIPEVGPEVGAGEADRSGGQAGPSTPDYQRAS